MVNYQNGKIYKIECNQTGKIYVGSTTKKTLAMRLAHHKCIYKKYLECNDNQYVSSFKVLENNNYNIILLESCPCKNRDELLARERYYIESIDCINMKKPLRTKAEYYQDNKDDLLEKQKLYATNHKDDKKEYDIKYRAIKKDKLQTKNICECGGSYTTLHKTTHEKTKKHLNYIANNNIDE